MDSAAGETIVTSLSAAQWGAPELETTEIVDANQRVIQAVGGAPIFAWVQDEAGARVRVMVARRAYSAPSFGVNLIGVGAAQTDGCGATEFSVDRPALVTVDGTRVPLTKVDNTWSFWCEIEP